MKRIIAFIVCMSFIFAFTGCKTKSAEDIEKDISAKLEEAKYADTHITGSIAMNVPDAGQQKITIDADYKLDASGEIPKMLLDGNIGLEGIMSFPMSFFMDENNAVISVLGQSAQAPIDEETKSQLKLFMGENAVKTNFNKTVASTTYEGTEAIELNYDLSALNQLMAANSEDNVSINSFKVYYLLKDKDKLDSIAALISLTSEGEQMDINLNIKINSIGQSIDITAPTVSVGTDKTLDILTNQQTNKEAA